MTERSPKAISPRVVPIAVLVALALAALASVGCGGDDDDDEGGAQAETISIAYPCSPCFATTYPFQLAEELGYFEEEGLDVSTEAADGSTGAVQQVVAGNVDAGLAAASAYLSAAAAGQDVRALYTTQYRNIFTLAVPADSGIDSVEDLEGRTIGVSELAGGEVPLIRGVLREAGVGADQYQIVPAGEGAALTADALRRGRVDAYSSNLYDVGAVRNAGVELETILPEVAETFPGNSVVTTAEILDEKREAFEGLLRAISKAVAFVEENPDEAFDMLAELSPEEFEERQLAMTNWEVVLDFLQPRPEEIQDEPHGTPFMPGLQAYHDFLLEGEEEEGALPGPVDLDTVIETGLLEAASDFDREEIAQ